MPDSLSEALFALMDVRREKGFRDDVLLGPGLSPQETRTRLEKAELSAPAELVSWFSWTNGADAGAWIAPRFYRLLDLDGALGGRAANLEIATGLRSDPPDPSDPVWKPSWLPIFEGAGDEIFVEIDSARNTVSVHYKPWEWLDLDVVRADSLADLIWRWVDLYKITPWNAESQEWELDYASLPARLNAVLF